jgi:hypothetical protein
MNCPRCNEAVEPGAAFCGNCGQPLQQAAPPSPGAVPSDSNQPSPMAQVLQGSPQSYAPQQLGSPLAAGSGPAIPGYATVNPLQHKAETRAMIGLILAVVSVPAAVVPFIGLAIAIVALAVVLPTRKMLHKKTMATVATVLAVMGLLLSIAAFAYNLTHYKKPATGDISSNSATTTTSDQTSSQAQASGKIAGTPCYQALMPGMDHTETAADSCNTQAYKGSELNTSRDVYTVQALAKKELTSANLSTVGKDAANYFLTNSLPGFTATSQNLGTFANSPAYYLKASNADGATVVMALVVHSSSHGENVFAVIHAVNGQSELTGIEKNWEWK